MDFSATLGISIDYNYAVSHFLTVVPNLIRLSVVLLSVVMLSVVMLNVVELVKAHGAIGVFNAPLFRELLPV
jgi:hypothetical protein